MTTAEARKKRTPDESRRIAAAAARASIKLYKFDNMPVPQWLVDTAAGRPVTTPTDD